MANPEHLKVAREGKSVWDRWQRAHPDERADFSGTDFTTAEHRDIVFSGFQFAGGVDFSETNFGDTPIPYQKHGTGRRDSPKGAALFDGAVFRGETSFRRARFGHDARFDGAIFEKAAQFADARFMNEAQFSAAVLGSAAFSHASFGNYARFEGAVFVEGPSFEGTVFGDRATFEGASFERAFFYMARFGHEADFSDSVFAAKDMAVQFNDAVFGDNPSFEGTAFECRAYFNEAEFGDRACFGGRDPASFSEAAATHAKELPERYRDLYLTRAGAADSRAFREITFSGARFAEGVVDRYGRESRIDAIRLFFPRLLHSPESRRMRALDPGPGPSFRGRHLQGVCDFSRVRFDQLPDFGAVEHADNLDLSGASFSLRGATWPRWRYWTTNTATATRIRRLRKLASDVQAEDAARDLLALERMATLGIEWSAWWAEVVRPWDRHRMMRPTGVEDALSGRTAAKPRWSQRIGTSVWLALRGVGRPAVWTVLTILYRVLSDFGRSVVLPTLWFLASIVGFSVWYGEHTTVPLSASTAKALVTFTLANSIPLAGFSQKASEDAVAVLFQGGVPTAVHVIGLLNSLMSTVILFLIAFAVRNRFRIS